MNWPELVAALEGEGFTGLRCTTFRKQLGTAFGPVCWRVEATRAGKMKRVERPDGPAALTEIHGELLAA